MYSSHFNLGLLSTSLTNMNNAHKASYLSSRPIGFVSSNSKRRMIRYDTVCLRALKSWQDGQFSLATYVYVHRETFFVIKKQCEAQMIDWVKVLHSTQHKISQRQPVVEDVTLAVCSAENRVQSGSADVQSPQQVPSSSNLASKTWPQLAIGHHDSVSTVYDDDIYKSCLLILSSSCLELATENCSQQQLCYDTIRYDTIR